MLAISLYQPWAQLIAIGAKLYETRSWSTRHRGWMAIHAGKKWSSRMFLQCYEDPFFDLLRGAGIRLPGAPQQNAMHRTGLPLGAIVAVADLADVIEAQIVLRGLGPQERAFGDFSHGRYAWRYRHVMKLPEPIPYRGEQGLFEIDQATTDRILDQVKPLKAVDHARR